MRVHDKKKQQHPGPEHMFYTDVHLKLYFILIDKSSITLIKYL